MRENYLENDFAEYWIENGILIISYKPRLIITTEVAKKIVADRIAVSAGTMRPGLNDIRNLVSVDRDAMKYFKRPETVQYVSAGAFLLDDFIKRFLMNLFINLDKPLVPTKFFNDRAAAISWLEQFKHNFN